MAYLFPGMDPHLENPRRWRGVHHQLLSELRALLVAGLKSRYFVDVETELIICRSDDPGVRHVVGDASILRDRRKSYQAARGERGAEGACVVLRMVDEIELRESRLVIRSLTEDKPVTVIELLSPTNKTRGSHGRKKYLQKRSELLRSDVHLVEVDLLRAGERFPSADPLPPADYYVHVSRVAMRPKGEVWPIGLRDPLPRIPIPLAEGDEDCPLDLGEAVRQTYERGGYDARIDYGRAPDPPLSEEDAAWMARILAQRQIPQ